MGSDREVSTDSPSRLDVRSYPKCHEPCGCSRSSSCCHLRGGVSTSQGDRVGEVGRDNTNKAEESCEPLQIAECLGRNYWLIPHSVQPKAKGAPGLTLWNREKLSER